MMDVYWLEQSEADVPMADNWLCESEAAQLSNFRFAKRRADWRLGRWTAKRAVAASLQLPDDYPSLKQIEIIPASTGQPEVVFRDRAETVSISISHRSGIAICAVAVGIAKLGCDLEIIETRSDAFIADYFTAGEQELIAKAGREDRSLLASLLWSAKECALKALHVGLRADTRSVEVKDVAWHGRSSQLPNIFATKWRPLQVHCADGTLFRGWWQHSANSVRTVVAAPPPAPPIELRSPTQVAATL